MTIKLKIAGASVLAIVDDDFAHLQRYRWRLSPKGTVFRHGDRVIQLHQIILGSMPLPGFVVAWKNRNRLDCRKRNLHCVTLATKAELSAPSRPNRSCGVRGVYFDRSHGKFVAELKVHGVRRRLGRFDTLEKAAAAVLAFRLETCRGPLPRVCRTSGKKVNIETKPCRRSRQYET